MLNTRFIKQLLQKEIYKIKDLYVAPIVMVIDIIPVGYNDKFKARAQVTDTFDIFYKSKFSNIYTRVKNGISYQKFGNGAHKINEFYIAEPIPLYDFMCANLINLNLSKNTYIEKQEVANLENMYKEFMSNNSLDIQDML